MTTKLKLSLLTIALAASSGAWAQTAPLSPDEYKAAVARAEADYRVARERCNTSSGTTKAICVAEAKAAEKRAKADAMEAYKNTDKARYDARVQRAEADYMVAKERCAEKAGNARDVCLQEAKAAEATARADAKVGASNSPGASNTSPRSDAVQSGDNMKPGTAVGEREAARAQCETMESGPARDECIAAAERPGRM